MFAPAANLRQASRLPALPRTVDRISASEFALLLACGALAAMAVCGLHLSFRVPGHAILRAVFPMAAGLAIVPRRAAGAVMAASALFTTAALRLGNLGEIQFAALVSLLVFGPMLDLALVGAPVGWKLYTRFAAAGAAANLVAFAVRYAFALLFARGGRGNTMGGGMENNGGFGQLAGGLDFLSFWPLALLTFTLCGAAAGGVSAAVWFRLRVSEDR